MNVDVPFFPIPPDSLDGVVTFCEELTTAIYDYTTQLNDILSGQVETVNLAVTQIHMADTGEADTEFTVVHGLGSVPSYFLWNLDKAGTVYASRRSEWTELFMYLKCSAANAELYLLVMK
jgi:hypothetical protein